jgi:predicted metalloprotease with PDZ domain
MPFAADKPFVDPPVAIDTACRQESAMHALRLACALSAALILAGPATAQPAIRSAPQVAALPAPVPEARDVPFPGTIDLNIDASDVQRGVFRVVETVPVPPGEDELILQLPEWHPGKHDARGAMNLIADVSSRSTAARGLDARPGRDLCLPHPAARRGRQVTARFVYTSPLQTSEGRIVMTQEMLNLQWEAMSLYPAGHYVRQIRFDPTVRFPTGGRCHRARRQAREGDTVRWATVDYETLVDSPVFAAVRAQWDLGHDVRLSAVADKPEQLALAPEHLATFEQLVDEALALYRRAPLRPLRHPAGADRADGRDRPRAPPLERERLQSRRLHQVGRLRLGPQRRRARAEPQLGRQVPPPGGLWTPDYRQPMQDNLLWMYEGQDQFWGCVLAARSGLQPKDIVLGALASFAGFYSVQPGRAWRSVEDTTFDPIIDKRRPQPYQSLNRNEDYYSEGMLVWLEADQIIREGTAGGKGLDDFARRSSA